MVGVELEFIGHKLEQAFFYLVDIFSRCDAGTVGDAEYVRVYGDGRVPEGGVEDDVGGLASDARQVLKLLAGLRHFPIVARNEQVAGLDDVFCLRMKQADGADVALQLV